MMGTRKRKRTLDKIGEKSEEIRMKHNETSSKGIEKARELKKTRKSQRREGVRGGEMSLIVIIRLIKGVALCNYSA